MICIIHLFLLFLLNLLFLVRVPHVVGVIPRLDQDSLVMLTIAITQDYGIVVDVIRMINPSFLQGMCVSMILLIRLVTAWDKSEYPVCIAAKQYLVKIYNKGIIDINQVNPRLYDISDSLNQMKARITFVLLFPATSYAVGDVG